MAKVSQQRVYRWIIGGSDDDSVMYEHRDRGNGVEPENHLESEYDIDFNTGE